ncbi:UBC-like protein [Delitschia confertaspora ATCC 74209]|uniref:UBC-like protein n=1 Tax=Delitschia confertaspora ATCC 74209 TaxID=1513339 RepID=A0A9P4JPD7_9PLEO|nr:UBC-like protein [Delitschia confertaspora ATCC 74209]
MSTRGQFNTKNPTIKRILKEASELASYASPDYYAEPLEDNLFEWHFTLRGPPAPSPYEGGIYHGRIVLPSTYPLRPPSFRFLTPTGRFEVNREICLSISGHHEETWQPAWGIRTALTAIRSFMDTDAKGQLGGIECNASARKKMAAESGGFKCEVCGKSNAEIIAEKEEAASLVEARGGRGKRKEEVVPEELRLAYRDELGKERQDKNMGLENKAVSSKAEGKSSSSNPVTTSLPPAGDTPSVTSRPPPPQAARVAQAAPRQAVLNAPERPMEWVDVAIYGIVAALLFMAIRKFL